MNKNLYPLDNLEYADITSNYSRVRNMKGNRLRMTRIVKTENNSGIVLASDTWNTNYNRGEIHKIAYNAQNRIAIALAGINAVRDRLTGKVTDMLPYMQEACDMYDGTNFWDCAEYLNEAAHKLIDDLPLRRFGDYNTEEFIVVAWDSKSESFVTERFIYERFLDVRDDNQEEEILVTEGYIEHEKYNKNCTALGIGSKTFDGKHLNHSFEGASFKEMKEWTIHEVQKEIDADKHLPVEKRKVGGHVEWVAMDKSGNITTNINDTE